MATLIIIKKAILDMKDRTGSSLPALKKWIETNEKVRQRNKSFAIVRSLFMTIFYCISV